MIPEYLGPLITALTVFTAIAGFGYYFDNKITQEYRNLLLYILDIVFPDDKYGIKEKNNWPFLLIFLFDFIFNTNKENERPAFWRSIAVSSSIFSIILIVWIINPSGRAHDVYQIEFVERFNAYGVGQVVLVSVAILAFMIFINGIGDFFSLWASRIFIGRMAKSPTKRTRAIILMLDAIVSVLIFVVGVSLALIFSGITPVSEKTLLVKFSDTFGGFFLENGILFANNEPQFDLLCVMFYTTLVTSIWVWAFLIGMGLWRGLKFVRKILDAKKHPLGTLMTLGAVPIALSVAVAGYVA